MALELSDYVIVGILMAAFIIYLYIYTDTLAMHVKINSSYDKYKAAWDREHSSKLTLLPRQ